MLIFDIIIQWWDKKIEMQDQLVLLDQRCCRLQENNDTFLQDYISDEDWTWSGYHLYFQHVRHCNRIQLPGIFSNILEIEFSSQRVVLRWDSSSCSHSPIIKYSSLWSFLKGIFNFLWPVDGWKL